MVDSGGWLESVTVTGNVKVPAEVGMPLICPFENVRPLAGSEALAEGVADGDLDACRGVSIGRDAAGCAHDLRGIIGAGNAVGQRRAGGEK